MNFDRLQEAFQLSRFNLKVRILENELSVFRTEKKKSIVLKAISAYKPIVKVDEQLITC